MTRLSKLRPPSLSCRSFSMRSSRSATRFRIRSMIFLILIAIVIVLSHILYLFGAQRFVPGHQSRHARDRDRDDRARSLLNADGIRFMYTSLIPNFMGFTAVGLMIVAMIGAGVAEESGLVNALIRKLVIVSPALGADLHPGLRRHPVEHRRRRRLSGPDSAGRASLF